MSKGRATGGSRSLCHMEIGSSQDGWEGCGIRIRKLVGMKGGHRAEPKLRLCSGHPSKSQKKEKVLNTCNVISLSSPPFEKSTMRSPSFQVKGVKCTSHYCSTYYELGIALSTVSPHLIFLKQRITKPILPQAKQSYLFDINRVKF